MWSTVFRLSSAEAIFRHWSDVTKGQEKLMDTLAIRKTRCKSSGWKMCACIVAGHLPKKWNEVFTSSSICTRRKGSARVLITVKCLLSVMWPVSSPTKITKIRKIIIRYRPLFLSPARLDGLIIVYILKSSMLTCYLLNGTLLAKTWTVAPLLASGLVSSCLP